MKRENMLKLIQPPEASPSAEHGEDAEPTSEEIAAAEELRRSLEAGEDALAASLGAAWSPHVIHEGASADLDAILDRVLGDEASATSLEIKAGERLRLELDRGEARTDGADAQLARALRAAARPRALDPAKNESLVWAALSSMRARRLAPAAVTAAVSVAALAAGLALFLGRGGVPSRGGATVASIAPIELARTRSTEDLFDATTPFPRTGQESARVDRIAASRAADLRNNRFASWGVR